MENNPTVCFWRNILFGSMFFGYVMYNLTRKSYNFSMPFVLSDPMMSLTEKDFGWLTSIQMIFYTIGKVFLGFLADYGSCRLLLSFGLFVCGLTNIVFSFGSKLVYLSIWCAVNGLFQGCGWAPIAVLITRWYSPTEAGTVWSLMTASINVSVCLTPFLMAALSETFHWRTSFQVIGIITCIASVILYFLMTDYPSDANKTGTSASVTDRRKKAINYREIFTSQFIWIISLSYMLWIVLKTGSEDWLQMLLITEKHFSNIQAGFGVTAYQIGGLFACLSSGVITDQLVKKYSVTSKCNPRLPAIIFCAFFILPWIFTAYISNNFFILLLSSFFMGLSCYGPHVLFGLVAVETAPDGSRATAQAIVSASSSVGSIIAGYPLAYLITHYGWSYFYVAMAVVSLLVAGLLLLTTRTRLDVTKKSI